MFFGVAGGVEPPKASPNLTLQTASIYRLNLRPFTIKTIKTPLRIDQVSSSACHQDAQCMS